MDIILVPGLWLDGPSWDRVTPALERAGHRAHPLTLPGLESRDADRSAITLRDHVDAVVAAVDAAPDRVALVGHSAGAAIAYAAVDARPEKVAHVVYVGGFPIGDGIPLADAYPAANGEVPLPDWSSFEDEDLTDLDDALRAEFRARAVPSPERVTRDPQRLTDERRWAVPTTVVCPEFAADQLRSWIAKDMPPVREFARLHAVRYVDLPTGHWPQFTRPEDLARVIVGTVAGAVPERVDDQGRPEPPDEGDELTTLLGFLDFHRATLAWKCAGLDAAGLRATTAASTMTLGGMLKHLAYVEDSWFSEWLRGNEKQPPWSTVDWSADVDWDWHSAVDDTPEELFALWRAAVERSRTCTVQALATGDLAQRAIRKGKDGRSPTLRWILTHMVEEYARHNGHADLIRESIDGETGE